MGALRTSSYQVTQPELVSTRQYPVNRSTGQLKDTEVCQLAGQIGTGHCLSTSSLSTWAWIGDKFGALAPSLVGMAEA